ncbi:MAG TPA: MarR family winged helix-turn-helix transcriptional regulator [Acidimicrobiales bacterium]|nr:MarR family winged helix-turn-helix transcriptional regulator [Acidimicrobiales bacterium]
MADGRWLDDDEARAWRLMQMMQAQLNAELARDLASHSQLSYQDYVVLIALTESPGGALRLFELGRALGWEKSRLSHQVARMQARGLVGKGSCSADRRGQVVTVTASGRESIAAAAPSHVAAVRRLFVDRVTALQLSAVAAVATSVLEGIEQARRGECRHADGLACDAGGSLPTPSQSTVGSAGTQVGGGRRAVGERYSVS